MRAREPLSVELLLDADKRRVTVDEHQAFRESISPPPAFDEIDEAAAVPDPPQKRSDRETNHVLKILDELQRGQG